MMDFAAARAAMVEGQVRTNDVTDHALQAALREIPRELFAPKSKRALAYADLDVPLTEDRWLIRPRDLAKLMQALEIEADDVVLDIACGRGYSTAVLARVANMVVGVESQEGLVEKATEALAAAGVTNAAVVKADLKAGAPDQGPFNVIFVNGAVEEVPEAWFDQLADGGRLGVVVREGEVGRAKVFTRAGGAVGARVVFDCASPLLPGFERPKSFTFQ